MRFGCSVQFAYSYCGLSRLTLCVFLGVLQHCAGFRVFTFFLMRRVGARVCIRCPLDFRFAVNNLIKWIPNRPLVLLKTPNSSQVIERCCLALGNDGKAGPQAALSGTTKVIGHPLRGGEGRQANVWNSFTMAEKRPEVIVVEVDGQVWPIFHDEDWDPDGETSTGFYCCHARKRICAIIGRLWEAARSQKNVQR